MKNWHLITLQLFLLFAGVKNSLMGQSAEGTNKESLFNIIKAQDSALFNTFNTCDLAKNESFFTEDIKFYHDKGGLITSKKTLAQNLENMCQSKEKTRRELVKGSLKVFPINHYGALQMGEHNFYQKEDGKQEKHGSNAKFIHLWQFKNNEWKISRVLSFDHANPSLKEESKHEFLYKKIEDLDKSFFSTNNYCNLDSLQAFLSDDIEFYHDRKGLTVSAEGVAQSIKENICDHRKGKGRRELIEGSFQVFPINNFGAIEMGEQRFYFTEPGKEEKLTGRTKFVMVWHKQEENWKIVLLYDYDFQSVDL